MTKHSRQPSHAQIRALERHGVKLNGEDLRAIAAQCALGRGRLQYLPRGMEKHLVEAYGRALVVVYHPDLRSSDLAHPHGGAGSIITILPREAALSGGIARAVRTKRERDIRRQGHECK